MNIQYFRIDIQNADGFSTAITKARNLF